ncbi:MAG: efflux RND transporter periplasmic adaptor subunit [Planctomycetota bacterium]|jgi:Cu(I)/Ag(I) efflux system membrane fusion protein
MGENPEAGKGSAKGTGRPGLAGRLASYRTAGIVAAVVIAAFFGGYVVRGCGARDGREHVVDERKPLFWTCSMHPQVRSDRPGLCHLCPMKLIPVYAGAEEKDLGPRQIRLTDGAARLAQVRTAPAERRFVELEVRMVGKVQHDETRVAQVAARVGGRIDDLFADYTGVPVRKGEHLFQIYSPEILAAQEELLQAVKAEKELEGSAVETIRRTAAATVVAAREKLRLWGLLPEQIREIEERGSAADHVTVNSPINGIVVALRASEGSYVKTGTVVYVVADLTRVWVKLDAYESDLPWVRYGQGVEFTADAFPGETVSGRIAFIDPVLDERSRTVKVRVNVPNESGRLLPGMFVRGTVRATLTEGGAVLDPDLSGKWISPMHPEIVKDSPGKCDVCGMPLVPAEKLGYAPKEAGAPLVIPATAPLLTGRRAVVYVDLGGGVFEGREVVLGARAGDDYIVRSGLEEGEKVVTNGNFKIDSALQILGRRSMMAPEGGAPPTGHGAHAGHAQAAPEAGSPEAPARRFEVPREFARQSDEVLTAYFAMQKGLSKDDFDAAKQAAADAARALEGVDMGLLKGDAHVAWMKDLGAIRSSLKAAGEAGDIGSLREAFHGLSDAIIGAVKRFGPGGRESVHTVNCPMAFGNRGADWLSAERKIENPYFGSRMFGCGEVTGTITAEAGK